MRAFLVLEDGHIFEGKGFGAVKDVVFEVVFNTSMVGYLEVMTDPSYAGQGTVMTYPLIGNYGINLNDAESLKPWVSAFIVRELSRLASNFRNELTLEEFMLRHDVPGIEGIDTRALTKILRNEGTMNALLTFNEERTKGEGLAESLKEIRSNIVTGVVEKVSQQTQAKNNSGKLKVALMDFGAKKSISDKLIKRGLCVKSYNCNETAEQIISDKPDGILLTNGPGDPAECKEIIANIRKLYETDIPIFAICLGHQLMALATGGTTSKLKYGHRGVNHPVKDLETGKVYITSQNHGYVVDKNSIDPSIAEVSHINVNDGTVEGLRFKNKNIQTVQFHPEASGGPWDTEFLFDKFIEMMEGR